LTLNDVLLLLLEAMDATGETHLVGWDTVQQWPDGAFDRLLEAGILTSSQARLASTSFMFMLVWVPDPVYQTDRGKSCW